MSKMEDLRTVLSAAETSGVESLRRAMHSGRVIHGRFISGKGGCLVYWASDRTVVDRPSREKFEASRAAIGCECSEEMRRVIVGWDANSPDTILKGDGYDEAYPKATYVITPEDVIQVIDEVLAERASANANEDAAVAKCEATKAV
jgi:hypothetical protein